METKLKEQLLYLIFLTISVIILLSILIGGLYFIYSPIIEDFQYRNQHHITCGVKTFQLKYNQTYTNLFKN